WNQTTGLQNDVAVPKSGFRLAGLDESVADHGCIVNRRTEIEVKILRHDRVSQNCCGGFDVAVEVKNLSDFRLCTSLPTLVVQRRGKIENLLPWPARGLLIFIPVQYSFRNERSQPQSRIRTDKWIRHIPSDFSLNRRIHARICRRPDVTEPGADLTVFVAGLL